MKLTKIIQDVMYTSTKKTKCNFFMFVITIFEGHNVLSPLYTTTSQINTKEGDGEDDYNSYEHASDNQ